MDRVRVYGDGWGGETLPNPRPLVVWDDARAHHPLAHDIYPGGGGMLTEQLRSFVKSARGLSPVPAGSTYADGLLVTSLLAKLKRSAALGHPMRIDDAVSHATTTAGAQIGEVNHKLEYRSPFSQWCQKSCVGMCFASQYPPVLGARHVSNPE